ncbi:Methyltransferase-like protein 4 [Linnemannia zychae]|nr:Methyltransferase-like protein 4 [Linnemannia zychae]
MKTRIISSTSNAVFIAPVKEPIIGWSIRPGTFRVAQPYDKPTLLSKALKEIKPPSTAVIAQPEGQDPPRKKQKLSSQEINSDSELNQWIQTTFQSLLEDSNSIAHIASMQKDGFYGTIVNAPVNEEYTLDLIKAQPMIHLLRHGFQSASTHRQWDKVEDNATVEFDEIQLDPDSYEHQLEIIDVYETLVVNKGLQPAFITFSTEQSPHYIMPSSSAFVASDFNSIQGLKPIAALRGGFDIIVMDPPWQNASVDRMGHYETFDLYELFKIPIPDMLSPIMCNDHRDGTRRNKGGIVAVWITNRTKIRKVVVEKLFPAWGLELVAQWYWLKITTHGEPVLSLDNKHRRPYESILIGKKKTVASSGPLEDVAIPTDIFSTNIKRRLIVSVPSQHSRKPSIMDLLSEEYFKDNSPTTSKQEEMAQNTTKYVPNRLELFARTLEEGVLSWGNEPFKYQYCGRGAEPLIQDGYLNPLDVSSTTLDTSTL